MTVNNECPSICVACKRHCCKEYSGGYHPEDLEPLSVDSLVARFIISKCAIDWWEGDPREDQYELGVAYYIRPAHKGVRKLCDPSWGGECCHLTQEGCALVFDKRPWQCRELVPELGHKCSKGVDKREVALAWIPYQKMIIEAKTLILNAS